MLTYNNHITTIMKKIFLYTTSILLITVIGCKKDYLETKPNTSATEEDISSKLLSTTAALDGIYKEQFTSGIGGNTGHDNFGQKSVDLQLDLMGNDMVVHSQGYGWFNGTYNLTTWQNANNSTQSDAAWYRYYDMIKQANKIIAGADNLKDATTAQIQTIKGQAFGLRAYCYFYLVNLFQQTYKGNENKPGVPLYTKDTTGAKPRAKVSEVYQQIISDLGQAETMLTGKTRAAKNNIDISVVQGFRARVALIMEDWATAATYANKARQGYTLMNSTQYVSTSAFSSVSGSENMWGSIIPAEQATIYASFYSHMDIRTGGYAALGGQKKITKSLYDQIPSTDVRKTVFKTPGTGTTSNPDYNQLKLQVPSATSWAGDYIYMRASEMYLIEAEALARQGQDASAQSVLETLVKARNPVYSAAIFTGDDLINEILLQRRIELWGEGFALLDIKRLKQGLTRPSGAGNHGAPSFDPGVYTTSAQDARFIMRIPQREIDNNPTMTPADQNP